MKKLILGVLILSTILVHSCDKSEWNNIPEEVKNSFKDKYPDAREVTWGSKYEYYVADFNIGKIDMDAWFDRNGVWYITEGDISYGNLPDAVKKAFEASEYKTWTIDDVDMLERANMETIYIIEIERFSEDIDIDLYYTADGVLVKVEIDNDDEDEHLPTPSIPTEIANFINEKYPNSIIADIDFEEYGIIEVDIIFEGKSREVAFNAKQEWINTSWDVSYYELPEPVKATLLKEYPNSEIDDIEYIDSPNGAYYLIEIENEPNDIDVKITSDGTIIQ